MRKSDDVTPFLILTSKMCWHCSKDDWLETIFLYNHIEFHLIPSTQGVNHLHTLYRNEIIVISKMSNFYDIIFKIWRPDYVTSVYHVNRKITKKLSIVLSFITQSLRVTICSFQFAVQHPHWHSTLCQNINTQNH